MKMKDLTLPPIETGPLKPLVAEALGTGALVLAAAGVGSAYGIFGGSVGGPQSALAPGLTLLVLLLLFRGTSLGLFNPALTLGMALAGRLPRGRVLPLAAAQLAGGLAAGLVLRVLLRSTLLGISATQMPGLAALLLEALLAFGLQWVYLAVDEAGFSRLEAALAISAALAAAIFWAGPFTGASMNPARSLGPAIASGDFGGLWIYLLGPCLGAAAAAWAWGKYQGLKG